MFANENGLVVLTVLREPRGIFTFLAIQWLTVLTDLRRAWGMNCKECGDSQRKRSTAREVARGERTCHEVNDRKLMERNTYRRLSAPVERQEQRCACKSVELVEPLAKNTGNFDVFQEKEAALVEPLAKNTRDFDVCERKEAEGVAPLGFGKLSPGASAGSTRSQQASPAIQGNSREVDGRFVEGAGDSPRR